MTKNRKSLYRGCFTALIILTVSGTLLLAQKPDLNKRYSLSYTGIPVEVILDNISDTSGIQFSYSRELVPVMQEITYTCHNKPLKDILNDLFRLSGIAYSEVNGYMVLIAEKNNNRENNHRTRTYTISGTIADSSNNEFMIGASVYDKFEGTGVISNNYGFYSFTLPEGSYSLQSSFIGYAPQQRTVKLNHDIVWNIRLQQSPVAMKEVVIQSVTKEEQVFLSAGAQTNIDPVAVKRQSAALGETDMIKSLNNLPGISFQSDGSSYFSVRGGEKDQNLILLDEAPIFNPSHLLGLFTPIIPDAIKHTEVYRADFPVQYGGRLSSVIDIRAKDGNMVKFSGSASISPVSTRFNVEGPFRKNYSSYFVSFRVSTFGLLAKAANPDIENFYFADFTSKFNFKLGNRDRIFLTLFAGKDVFINKNNNLRNGLEWGNTAATLRWMHVYGSRLFSYTTLFASKFDYLLYTDFDRKTSWNSDITGTNLKSEFIWYMNPRNNLRFGFHISGYFFNPGNYNSVNGSLDTMRVSQVNSGEVVVYAGDDWELARWLRINYGFRYSNWSNYGEAFSIVYDKEYKPLLRQTYAKGDQYYSFDFLEPRISISFKTAKYSSLKVSYNKMIQHINQINNSISPFNSLDVWLPSGPNLKPQQADIFNLGFLVSRPTSALDFCTDVYYKKIKNQVGYVNHAEMFLNPYLEGELRQGNGYGYGFEISIKKTEGKLTGLLGYAYSRSRLQINDLNNGRWYPSHYDKPVDITFSVEYKISPAWTLSFGSIYSSGMAISTPTGFYNYRGVQVPLYQKLNNDRLPNYKRIDVGSSWRLNKKEKTFEHYLTLTIYNLLNSRNYAFLNFNKYQGPDNKFYVPADQENQRNIMPTYRYIYSIIPSFTYSLKF